MKEIREKKPYGTGRVVFLSFLCVVLVFVLITGLLGSVTLRQLLLSEQIGDAAAAVPLEQITLPDGSALAAEINGSYVRVDGITDENVGYILRDGTFNEWVGEKAAAYAAHLLNPDGKPLPEITQGEISQLIAANDSTIQLHTGVHDFSAVYPETAQTAFADAARLNDDMRMRDDSIGGVIVRFSVTIVPWIVLSVLLLLVMIWLIQIHVRGKRHVGTAFKIFAVTAFIPSAVVFLAGALGSWVLGLFGLAYLQSAVSLLLGTPMAVGGIGALGCIVLFAFGMLWNAIARKHAAKTAGTLPVYDPAEASALSEQPERVMETVPASEPVTAAKPEVSVSPVSEPIIRHYCRFCGGELVNSDAKFCYKCGKPQEPTNQE